MPKDENVRKEWINSISKHQRLTSVDLATINFSICSQHFKTEDIHKTKSRVTVNGIPTIFPQVDEVSDEIFDDSGSSNAGTVVNPVER